MPNIYLTELVRSTREPVMPPARWGFPGDPIGQWDFSTFPQKASTNPLTVRHGIVVYASPQAGMALDLGTSLTRSLSLVQRSGIETLLGLPAGTIPAGATLAQAVYQIRTTLGDPTGETRWKPARGSVRLGTRMSIGGFGNVVREAINAQTRANAVAVFRADYDRNFNLPDTLAGQDKTNWNNTFRTEQERIDGVNLTDEDARTRWNLVLRRWTGAEMLSRFGELSQDAFEALLDAPRRGNGFDPPDTAVSDAFNRADENPVAGFTHDQNSFQLLTNEIVNTANNSDNNMRHDTALSTDDHWSEIAISSAAPNLYGGPTGRKASSATLTYYLVILRSGNLEVWEVVANSFNGPRTQTGVTHVAGDIYRVTCDSADDIAASKNGTQINIYDDPSPITGQLSVGAHLVSDTTARMDNFAAEDISAGDPEGSLVGGKLLRGGLLRHGVLTRR